MLSISLHLNIYLLTIGSGNDILLLDACIIGPAAFLFRQYVFFFKQKKKSQKNKKVKVPSKEMNTQLPVCFHPRLRPRSTQRERGVSKGIINGEEGEQWSSP